MRAGREPASAEAMELSFLELELARLDGEIAAAAATGEAPAVELQRQRAELTDKIAAFRRSAVAHRRIAGPSEGSENISREGYATRGVRMDTQGLAALAGVVFVALFVVSSLIGLSDSPDFAGPRDEIATFYADKKDEIQIATVLAAISVPFFIWFAGRVRSAIAKVEGGTARLASIAYGAAIAAVATGIAGTMVNAMGSLRVDEQGEIAADTATAYFDIGNILSFAATTAAVAATLFDTGLAVLRYKAILPAWFACITIVLGIVDVIPPISWASMMIGVLWVLIVSVMLYVSRAGEHNEQIAA